MIYRFTDLHSHMQEKYLIRRGEINDLIEVQRLNQLLFIDEEKYTDKHNKEWSYKPEAVEHFTSRLTGKGIVFVLVYNDDITNNKVIVGYLAGTSYNHWKHRHDNQIGLIETMYIEESHRRKGWGRQLVEAFYKHGKSLGINTFRVETLYNNVEALAFYRKLGLSDFSICLETDLEKS